MKTASRFMWTLALAGFLQAPLSLNATPSTAPTNVCFVVSYDHGGLVLWGYDHFLEHFRQLLGWLDRHPKLRMGLDNEAWMYDWLAENQPAVLTEIRQALDQYRGRLAIGSCNYGQPLAAFLTEESNVRQIGYGLAAVRERLGYDVSIYSWSEHAGFEQLPQILAGFGLRGVLMRTHYYMYGYCPGYDWPIAWWQAPDGSRIRCVPTYVNQERQVPSHRAHPPGPFGLTTEDTWILTRYPSRESPASLESFRSRFAHIQPLVASRIDDSGLKREELVSELDTRDDYQWVTLEQLFEELPTATETLTPTVGDFGTRMPWGYRGNELFDLSRRGEVALLTAERLLARTAASARGFLPDEAAARFSAEEVRELEGTLHQAWKDLLVGQHHDIQIVSRAGALGREHLLASLQQSRRVIRRLLEARVGGDTRNGHTARNDESPPEADLAGDSCFTAFNPLPWPRTEELVALPDGTEVEGPASVPSLGFATFQCSTVLPTRVVGLRFATEDYEVRFSTNGAIDSLCTRAGCPVFRPDVFSGRLAAVVDGQPCESSGVVSVRRGRAGFQVEDKGNIGPMPYTIRWFFPQQGTRIECRIAVRFNGERIGAPTGQPRDSWSCFIHEQKLRLKVFPTVNLDTAFGLHDLPFGVSQCNGSYVEGIHWSALADDTGGLLLANRGTMAAVREEDGSFSVPLAFTTDYIWGTEILSGEHEWSVAIIPWNGDWESAALHRQALEFAFPLVAVPGRLPRPSPDFLVLGSPDLHLTAFYLDQGRGYVRVFNATAQEQQIRWTLPDQALLQPVNLWHRDQPDMSTTQLRRRQFQTFRLW